MTEKGVKALSNGSFYITFSQVSLKQLNEEKKVSIPDAQKKSFTLWCGGMQCNC